MNAGTQLGSYEILSPLGKGGMGEVWRAKDQTLGREVAIKTLPEEFAKDEGRLARFEREAKLLASLNHPNIAAIYGLEEDNGTRFLVFELVEGDTLADRLKRGAIPVEESLKLALQIAEALEAAHEKGVIHRDLKPANIKVTPDGKVKVLDFGLAKAVAGETPRTDLSTLTVLETKEGIVQGTPAYMSPQQALGEVVDKRTDIWAFGCVLYEMLTGRRPFRGETLTDMMARILEREPDWKGLPLNLHPRIRLLLERCLEKEARDRYHDIADARVDIHKVLGDPASVLVKPDAAHANAAALSRLPWVVAVLGIVVAGVSGWFLRPIPSGEAARFVVAGATTDLVYSSGLSRDLAISPDGRTIVYSVNIDGRRDLLVRPVDRLQGRALNLNAELPFFSPDGAWIGYATESDRTIKRVSILGGPPVTITYPPDLPLGASWGADDNIIFASADYATGLLSVPAAGGEPVVLTTPDEDQTHVWPEILPGANGVLFTIVEGDPANWQIAVLDLGTGEYESLIRGGSSPQYASTGHIVYGSEGTLWAAPFDAERLELTGDPVPILEGVAATALGAVQFSISRNGSLVYLEGDAITGPDIPRSIVTLDRAGNPTPLAAEPRNYVFPRVSPDGTRIAVEVHGGEGTHLWILNVGAGNASQLTFEGSVNTMPTWTADGQRVIFSSDRDGSQRLFSKAADGTGEAQVLAENDSPSYPTGSSEDGVLAYHSLTGQENDRDIWTVGLEGGSPSEFLATPAEEWGARFSPDGRWIAYASNASGENQVYVRPFPPTGGGVRRISGAGGGLAPMWFPDGDELFYIDLSNGNLMAVPVLQTSPSFESGNTEELFQFAGAFLTPSVHAAGFDVLPGSSEFVAVLTLRQSGPSDTSTVRLNIILNWFEELKERVPVP